MEFTNLPSISKTSPIAINYNKDSTFNYFDELPDDIKTHILSFCPKYILCLNSKSTLAIKQCYLDYCYNLPISKSEIISLLDEDVEGLRYLTIHKKGYPLNGYGKEVYLYHVEDDMVNMYESIHDDFEYYHFYKKDLYVSIFGDEEVHIILDNNSTRKILSKRISCTNLDKDYIDSYIKHRNNAFLSYFNKYPIIMYNYFWVIGKTFPIEYEIIVQKIITDKLYNPNNYVETDEETYKVLNNFYSLLIS